MFDHESRTAQLPQCPLAPRGTIGAVLAVCVAVVLGCAPLMAGCSKKAEPAKRSSEFPDSGPGAPKSPAPVVNADPESAVRSYLGWITLAYRILNSDVASPTFTPEEEVRVNSYVEFNRQQGRAIDQRLVEFRVVELESVGSTATLAAREVWHYRYISTQTGEYSGESHAVSYDTTYTVVSDAAGGWRVASVQASPEGAPPE